MKNTLKLLSLLFLVPLCINAQHSISGTFSPKNSYTKVFLYQVNPQAPNYLKYISYTSLDQNGKITLELGKELPAGLYQLNFGIPRVDYHFNFIYNAKEDIVFEYNEQSGVHYIQSEENIIYREYLDKTSQTDQLLSAVFYPEVTEQDYKTVFEAIEEVQHHYEIKSQGLLAYHYIITGRSPIPEKRIGPGEYVSLEKQHYFKHINFQDPVLKNSFRLVNLSILYVLKFDGENASNAYKENTDEIMQRIGADNDLKKEVLTRLWVNFSLEENTEVANYIADTYLLDIANQKGDSKLISEINLYKATAKGSSAPDFELGDGRNLSELNTSERYLLIFWSSTCSHCLKELPEIRDTLKNIEPQELQVIAFGLEEEEFPWKETVKDYPNFIHVYGEGKWENKTSNDYNITSTPTYFILDKDKNILEKPENLEALLKNL